MFLRQILLMSPSYWPQVGRKVDRICFHIPLGHFVEHPFPKPATEPRLLFFLSRA